MYESRRARISRSPFPCTVEDRPSSCCAALSTGGRSRTSSPPRRSSSAASCRGGELSLLRPQPLLLGRRTTAFMPLMPSRLSPSPSDACLLSPSAERNEVIAPFRDYDLRPEHSTLIAIFFELRRQRATFDSFACRRNSASAGRRQRLTRGLGRSPSLGSGAGSPSGVRGRAPRRKFCTFLAPKTDQK